MNILSTNVRRVKDLIQYLKLFKLRKKMYYIENKNILSRISEDNVYKKYEREYASLIERGIESSSESVASNKIWILWLQGEENAPELVKACINSIRKNFSGREIIVLSENNISEYISFPEHIERKWKEKKIGAAHYSDLVRIALLCKYGGMWVDATVLCTSATVPKAFTDSPLFFFQAIDLIRKDREPILGSNWFISAYSNHPILMLTKELLYEYWKTNESVEHYFIFHIFFALAVRRYEEEWKKIPVYNNQSPHTLQFELGNPYTKERWDEITSISSIHKLNHHNDYTGTGESFYHYIINTFI